LLKSELRPHLRDARMFVAKHIDHPAIQAALKLLEDLIGKQRGPGYEVHPKIAVELRRLSDEGLEPREALENVWAVWLLAQKQPNLLRDDEGLTIQMANVLLKSRRFTPMFTNPMTRRPKYPKIPGLLARRFLGNFLRSNLGVLFDNADKHEEEKIKARFAAVAVLRTPFGSPNESQEDAPNESISNASESKPAQA